MKLSVVIPVYNEKSTLQEILKRVQAVEVEKEIILVDDASADGTRDLLKQYEGVEGIKVLYHEKNHGKGRAIATGYAHISGDFVVVQDADLEYDPKDYLALLKPLLEDKADVVYGSRFLKKQREDFYFWQYFGNRVLTILCNLLSNLKLTDMETCYKMFKKEVLEQVQIRSKRFGCEPEFTLKVAKNRFRVCEVPIAYDKRGHQDGKKITWKDGLAAIFYIFYYRFFD